MTYLRFSNGAVEQLININDEISQNEALDSGFRLVKDKNDKPLVVDSSEIIKERYKNYKSTLEAVSERIGNRSNRGV